MTRGDVVLHAAVVLLPVVLLIVASVGDPYMPPYWSNVSRPTAHSMTRVLDDSVSLGRTTAPIEVGDESLTRAIPTSFQHVCHFRRTDGRDIALMWLDTSLRGTRSAYCRQPYRYRILGGVLRSQPC